MKLAYHGSWKIRSRVRVLAAVTGVAFAMCSGALAQQGPGVRPLSIANLYQGFVAPPPDARPMVRWWWFGVAVEKPEILHELEQMKADGIGGVELAFEYPQTVNDPAHGLENLPFLSPAMLNAVAYAQMQARRLGLRVDVTLCSGWPYGGPSTTLANSAGHLRTVALELRPGETSVPPPSMREGDAIVSVELADGVPQHWDVQTARALQNASGNVIVSASQKERTVLFFIAGHTRQQVKRAAVGAEGYVLDPFSEDAVATYLKAVGDPLLKAFGTKPPYSIFSDSLEVYGADWTPDLAAEFLKRRGYDLIPHLPELISGGSVAADNVRHDYGRTLTELVDSSYLAQINAWAKAHHTRFRSQTYGSPAVSFSSQNLVGLAEGEGPQWREFSTLRWASSANHVFGHDVTSGETFTWLHSPVFRAVPLDMKAEADIDFIMGENQLIFHGWPYSPPQAGNPGWSLYAAAALNDHNPWHPVMPWVTEYIARISYLMRQGQPANQVAVLLPTDDAWARFKPGNVSVTDAMKQLVPASLMAAILSAGYNVDFIDADAIDRGGIGHQVLVLPPSDRIPAETLSRIAAYVANGGKVIAVGRAPSMSPDGKPQAIPPVCTRRADGGETCKPLFSGNDRTLVSDPSSLGTALHHAVAPDLELADADDATRGQIGFIRRKLEGADVYLMVNSSNREIHATATFQTHYRFAEVWDADTARRTVAPAASEEVDLEPYASRIFVFSNSPSRAEHAVQPGAGKHIVDISSGWSVTFTGTRQTLRADLPMDWTDDPGLKHYSGEAVYARDVTIGSARTGSRTYLQIDGGKPQPGAPSGAPGDTAPDSVEISHKQPTRTGPGMRAYFDPSVRDAALVEVNGRRVGAMWHPPYILDISKDLKPGKNHIEIRIYNTALNAWSAQPPHDNRPLVATYGERFQMQDLDKVRPLSSGLLGTVHLVTTEMR